MDLYPLKDCIQIIHDEDFKKITIYYYAHDVRAARDPWEEKMRRKLLGRRFDRKKTFTLYLCKEVWELEGEDYVKREDEFELMGDANITELFEEKYLTFLAPTHEWDFSYRTPPRPGLLKLSKRKESIAYYNLGFGCRWNRSWARDIEEDWNNNY